MRAPRVTDRDEREQRYLRNIRNAKATCSCCAECGRKLAADAPIWRERILLGVSVGLHRSRRPGMRWTTAPVCERCASVFRAATALRGMRSARASVSGAPARAHGLLRGMRPRRSSRRHEATAIRSAGGAQVRHLRRDIRADAHRCTLLFVGMPPACLSSAQDRYG
jgi:hypothetical protein